MNIEQRVFVRLLGCGCGDFPNANHLSMVVSLALLAGTGGAWWIASRGLGWGWKLFGAAGFLGWGFIFFRGFMYNNAWM
jgi:hypothetical protein